MRGAVFLDLMYCTVYTFGRFLKLEIENGCGNAGTKVGSRKVRGKEVPVRITIIYYCALAHCLMMVDLGSVTG